MCIYLIALFFAACLRTALLFFLHEIAHFASYWCCADSCRFTFLLFRAFFHDLSSFSFIRTICLFFFAFRVLFVRADSALLSFLLFCRHYLFMQFVVLVDMFRVLLLMLYFATPFVCLFFYCLSVFFLDYAPLLHPLLLPLILSGHHVRVWQLPNFLHCVHAS